MRRSGLQRRRLAFQVGFFLLFVLAPPLDILRIDLHRGHAILLGMDWTLGIDAFIGGVGSPLGAAFNLFWRGFLPLFGGAALFLWIAWRYGRLYCGWLCPHFSVVEMINGLMRRASGRPSVWERRPLPQVQPDGAREVPNAWYWLPTLLAVFGFALLWAVVLLTYLLPPAEVYRNLVHGELTLRQGLFIGAASIALSIEFLLARHLFCRFGCAVGLFQSLSWMANDRAMVVGFDAGRATLCRECNNACDNVCPMRLKPRTIKRRMFTCTECAQCISACATVQGGDADASLLRWVDGHEALPVVTGRPASASAPRVPDGGPRHATRRIAVEER
ncbi:MAG: 4Fe-4S binding protein [Chromatiaceae bacterium]|nr:4Fe-4S binding protein [Gammaproteobacteria bacterium]MCP5305951.1 4Fe-4S binding protein [Chromatiaceae bacterium]MCP5312811.1 4Fe-4S binding protein [Chromatiaceae bacterium]